MLGILDHCRELLVGKDPSQIEHHWSEIVRGTFWSTGQVIMSAVAGIDMALWDIKGKRSGGASLGLARWSDPRQGAGLSPSGIGICGLHRPGNRRD